jgi:peptidyl-Asp metalloendopeptidase
MTGTVRVGNDVYTYLPMGGGVHAVTKQGTSDAPPEHPPRFLEKLKQSSKNDAPPSVPAAITETVQIDILVAFSTPAKAGLVDLPGFVALGVEETNKSLMDSGVPGVVLRTVGVTSVPYKEEVEWNTHLDRLSNPKDPLFKAVHKLREQAKADIVVLVVADQRWCGEAREISASAATAFIVVSSRCFVAEHSFAHELGHLVGAHHDRKTDPAAIGDPWAHGYVNGTKWRTVMAYNVCNCRRVARWSNPNVLYENEPTGTVDFEFDAKVWQQYAKRIANFK